MASPSPTEIATLGLKALNSIKAVEPPQWLSPSPLLSEQARAASQYLFSALLPFCPDSPLNQLLLRGFDAEQIWHQIDLQTQPQISKIRREVKKFEKNPEKISVLNVGDLNGKIAEENKGFSVKFGAEQLSEKALDVEEEFDESVDGEENGDFSSGSEENEDEEEDAEEKEGINGGVEDQFLKIRDLEKFLKEEEAREFESEIEKRSDRVDDDDEDDDDDDDEEDDDDDEMGGGGGDDEDVGDDADGVEKSVKTPRYKDFFGGRKEKSSMKQSGGTNDELEDDDYYGNQDNATLSTHEKELEKVRSTIEQLERANMETKSWTMQGEVTAKKRPVNSALEVDLDFRHNVRPVPVITEEATTSLEDIIKRRISEGQWDDVQRKPRLPSKAPTERKEMDENKSQKGLAELYEEDYVQKAGLASAPQSFREKQMQEASILFKKLCLKLDALSHFHFAPKPVIEDMSIQANLPALAMEEIAPVAVSDAAMLAPEEVFAGKGDIKENTELTQEDRKRRRASKKRKFKAETAKQMVKEARDNIFSDRSKGQEP